MSSWIASMDIPRPTRTTVRSPRAGSRSAVANRRAGSTVRRAVRRPASARWMATAADTVVLPTPPAPQTTTIRAPASGPSRVAVGVSTGPDAPSAPPRARWDTEGLGVCPSGAAMRAARAPTSSGPAAPVMSGRVRSGASRPMRRAWACCDRCRWSWLSAERRSSSASRGPTVSPTPSAARRNSAPESPSATERAPRANTFGSDRLTTTAGTEHPAARTAPTASVVSAAAISSGKATRRMEARRRSMRSMAAACRLIRPDRARSATAAGAARNEPIWPVGGASTTTRSYRGRPWSRRFVLRTWRIS